MGNKHKSFQLIAILGCFIALSLIFSACSPRWYGQKIQVKKWVNWEIEFKKNTTESERALAIIALEKYIINHSYIDDTSGIRLYPIRVTLVNLGQDRFEIFVDVGSGDASTSAVSTVKPKGPGPRYVFIPKPGELAEISLAIAAVKELSPIKERSH